MNKEKIRDIDRIQEQVRAEMVRQIEKHGQTPWTDDQWLAILKEEVAEVNCDITLGLGAEDIHEEVIQIAAVAQSWLLCLQERVDKISEIKTIREKARKAREDKVDVVIKVEGRHIFYPQEITGYGVFVASDKDLKLSRAPSEKACENWCKENGHKVIEEEKKEK